MRRPFRRGLVAAGPSRAMRAPSSSGSCGAAGAPACSRSSPGWRSFGSTCVTASSPSPPGHSPSRATVLVFRAADHGARRVRRSARRSRVDHEGRAAAARVGWWPPRDCRALGRLAVQSNFRPRGATGAGATACGSAPAREGRGRAWESGPARPRARSRAARRGRQRFFRPPRPRRAVATRTVACGTASRMRQTVSTPPAGC